MTIATTRVDYAALDPERRGFVQEHAAEIRRLARRAVGDMLTIGQHLIAVKDRLQHGQFGQWLAAEFAWSQSLASFSAPPREVAKFRWWHVGPGHTPTGWVCDPRPLSLHTYAKRCGK